MNPVHLIPLIPILLGSLYDIYVSIKTHTTLIDMELNPVGRWLIALDNGVALFMTLKCAGNIVVILLLAHLMVTKPRIGWPVAWGLVIFQAILLAILIHF